MPAQEKKHKAEDGTAQPAAADADGLKKEKAWRVALRVVHDIEGPNSKANNDITQSKGRKRDYRAVGEDGVKTSTIDDNVTPAVVIQTNDGDAYYMLGDFNHVRARTDWLPVCLAVRPSGFPVLCVVACGVWVCAPGLPIL
eukprot:COSAG06_NODE_7386_length_2522_cov_1.635163_3_plen_141_part_00